MPIETELEVSPPCRLRQHRLRDRVVTCTLVMAACGVQASSSPISPEIGADGQQVEGRILVTVKQRQTWRAPRAGTSGRLQPADYKPSARTQRVVANLARAYGLQ